jgi:rare lipoprotein A
VPDFCLKGGVLCFFNCGGNLEMKLQKNMRKIIPLMAFVISMVGFDVAYAKYRPQTQIGVASYYGKQFHGRKTANGERFDMNKLTAAHRTYPFGTVLQVTNLRNNKRITVRVNDRGPYVGGRVIDLSKRAAQELGFINSGVTKVKIEVVSGKKGKQDKKLDVDNSYLASKEPEPQITSLLPTETDMLW